MNESLINNLTPTELLHYANEMGGDPLTRRLTASIAEALNASATAERERTLLDEFYAMAQNAIVQLDRVASLAETVDADSETDLEDTLTDISNTVIDLQQAMEAVVDQ